MTVLALVLLVAPFLLGVALTALTAHRTRSAWAMKRHVARELGYRDAPVFEGRVVVRPKGLVGMAGLASAVGATAVWPVVLVVAELRVADSPSWLGIAFLLAMGTLLIAIVGAALSLVARHGGSAGLAHAIGGAGVVIGVLVVVPIVCWPRWFGAGDAHQVLAALGVASIVGGAALARAAWLTQTAELEIVSEPTLFDPA